MFGLDCVPPDTFFLSSARRPNGKRKGKATLSYTFLEERGGRSSPGRTTARSNVGGELDRVLINIRRKKRKKKRKGPYGNGNAHLSVLLPGYLGWSMERERGKKTRDRLPLVTKEEGGGSVTTHPLPLFLYS